MAAQPNGSSGTPPLTAVEYEAMWAETQRNQRYFVDHADDLFAQHPGKMLLVHSEDQVEVFEDPLAMVERMDALTPISRRASLSFSRPKGAWIL